MTHPLTLAPTGPEPSEEALQHLSQILAHRLRGLVTSIEGFADLLTDTLPSREQREMLLRIFEGTSRIERVLMDLQRYSQPVQPLMRRVTVAEILGGLQVALSDEEFERLSIAWEASNIPFQADPMLFRQTLLALLQNAFDADAEGTVRLVVSREQGSDEEQVRFDVWNQTPIPGDDPERQVFVPFYTTKAQNLGVGLSLARRIAEAHEGTLQMTSNTAEEGVCFSVRVPVLPAEEAPSAPG